VAGLNNPSLVTQYWNMIQAQNLSQFTAAESMLQMPFFNVMYADRNNDIFYLFGGQQPVRNANNSWQQYFGQIQDGTTSSTLWTQTFTFSQLPQATNPSSGVIANSNNPPWNTVLPVPASLNPANYPPYVAPDFMEFRPQHGATFLQSQRNFTTAQVLAGKMSTEMYLADRLLPDLLVIAGTAANKGDQTAKAAAAVLSEWDRTGDAASVGGVLFEEWWNEVEADVEAGKIHGDTSDSFYYPHPAFRIPWSPSTPITTPSGLDPENDTQLLADLDHAYTVVATNFASQGGAKVAWGNAHKTTLVTRTGATQQLVFPFLADAPLSGADDDFGPLRVVNPLYVSALDQFISYGGDGYVQLIEFTPTGSQGGTLLTYGNASRPNSPHITDQLTLFSNKQLKPALRTYQQVQAAAVSQESF
jgi:acyl-homoserine-lactone acylase